MDKREEYKYDKWKTYLEDTRKKTNYSVQRMELLIISISGGGLYLIFQIVKEIKISRITIENPRYLFIPGILFLVAIGSNFISQITGYKANSLEEELIQNELSIMEGEEIEKEVQNSLEKRIEKFNQITSFLNYLSIAFMFLGLVCLTFFNLSLF